MPQPPTPQSFSEQLRLQILRAYHLLDTPPEPAYDDLVKLAAHVCNTPMATITLIDEQRQWFKAAVGLSMTETARNISFCTHVVDAEAPLVVTDATQDPRFAANPFVAGAPHIRFYAGIPLVSSLGAILGTLAVIDQVPRQLTPEQMDLLRALAHQAMTHLELRFERYHHRLTALRLTATQQTSQVGIWQLLVNENRLLWTESVCQIFGVEPNSFNETLDAFLELVHPDDRQALVTAQAKAIEGNSPLDIEYRIIRPDGELRYLHTCGQRLSEDDMLSPLLIGTIQDVTAEKQAQTLQQQQQQDLHYAHDTLSFHLQNSPLAAIEWDWAFRVSRWSPQAEALFGWSEAEVKGRHPGDWLFVYPADVDTVEPVMTQLINGEVKRNVCCNRNLTRDGLVVHCEWYNSVRLDQDDNIVSIFSLVLDVTERVQAEQATAAALDREKAARAEAEAAKTYFRTLNEKLRISEDRLRRTFAAAATGIVAADLQGRFLEVNEAFCRMVGYTEAELLQTDYIAITHPEDRAASRDRMQELIRGDRDSFVLKKRFITQDQRVVWGRVSVSIQQNAAGQAVNTVAVIEDITQQIQIAQQLQESRTLARIAERLGRLGGWAIDIAQDNQVHWSEEMFHLLEWPADQAASLELGLERYLPEYRSTLEVALAQCAETGTPFDLEVEILTFQNHRLWVRVIGEAEHNAANEIVRIIGAFQDISARKQAESALDRFASRLHTTLESMTDAFYLLDDQWRFAYLNREAERVLQCKADTVMGQVVWEVLPGSGGSELFPRYHQAVAKGQSQHFEFYYPPLDEWFEVNAYPSAEGLAVYFRVISDRIALEEQLRQSQRLEAIGHLTGGIAHDFNNLLTVMLGNAELLTEMLDQFSPLHPLAEMIASAAQRGAELTQRLLAFARRQALKPQAVNVNQLLLEMNGLLQRTLGEHIQIEVFTARDLWSALVDPAQLESTILNLCINNRDAMAAGGTLTIETCNANVDHDYAQYQAEMVPGQYVMITVSDTGTGIAPQHLDRVFEPFFTTKETGKGTGLGLSMVYGFVKQSNGHIKIYSELGEGTTIRLYLPRYMGGQNDPLDVDLSMSSVGRSELVLLVEDDALVRQYAHRQLQSLGYTVAVAENGPAALDIIRQRDDIDLLFTDVVMPGAMSGRDLADAARRLRPHLRVLYTSGYSESTIIHQGRLDPGVQLLSKPYRRTDLARKLREVLDQVLNQTDPIDPMQDSGHG
jgi:PAS domain S-box-containing protein